MPSLQYTTPSYHTPVYTGNTVTIPMSSHNYVPAYTSATGSVGTTVTLKRPASNTTSVSLASRPSSSAGATVSLGRRPNQPLGAEGAAKKVPTGVGTLTGSRQTALTSVQKMLNRGTLRLTGDDRSLTVQQVADLASFLNSPQSNYLTQTERGVLTKILNGQPLTQAELGIALNTIGENGMNQFAAAAIVQGALDNIGASNPNVPGNNPGSKGGILGAIAKALQALPNSGSGGGSSGGAGDSGSGGGPALADAGSSDAGAVGAPVVDNSSVAQPGTPAAASGDGSPAGDSAVRQFRRYLQVKNDSAAKLTVYVQYSAQMNDSTFQWFPTRPGGDQAVGFTLAPGSTIDVDHDGWRVKADRVRIWAVADDGTEVTDYRDQDLWLVAEQHGDRAYYAPDPEAFTFTFGR